jgi:CheY-like chemotaxis protein
VAEDGRRALQAVRDQPVDLVLLDVLMPEMDGYETLRQLKANPSLRDIPVIMISALDEIQSVVRCIEHGAEDYLPKPNPVLLRARIGVCLEKKWLRDQEVLYLQDISRVTSAAGAVESGAVCGRYVSRGGQASRRARAARSGLPADGPRGRGSGATL